MTTIDFMKAARSEIVLIEVYPGYWELAQAHFGADGITVLVSKYNASLLVCLLESWGMPPARLHHYYVYESVSPDRVARIEQEWDYV